MRGLACIGGLLAVGLVAAAPPLKVMPEPTIVGKWSLVSIIHEGILLPIRETKYVFLPNGILRKFPDERPVQEEIYKVNTAAVPAELDWYGEVGDTLRRAIWKVDGDRLVICNNTIPDAARPTSFTSPVGSQWFLVTLKRVSNKECSEADGHVRKMAVGTRTSSGARGLGPSKAGHTNCCRYGIPLCGIAATELHR